MNPQPVITVPGHGILLYESRHTAGFDLPEHAHPFYEILLFIGGAGSVLLRGAPHPVEAGSLALVGPGLPHRLEDHPERPLSLFVLAFRPEAVQPLPESAWLLRPFAADGTVIAGGPALSHVTDLVRRILYEQEHMQFGWTVAVQAALSDLLLQVCRVWLQTEGTPWPRSDSGDPRLESLRRYIAENYYGKLNLDTLARRAHLSIRQLSHLFKRQYGMTPMDYLTAVRVERAKALLRTTDKEIVAVCFEVGYENLSHFYRIFKAATGISPLRYRRQGAGAGLHRRSDVSRTPAPHSLTAGPGANASRS